MQLAREKYILFYEERIEDAVHGIFFFYILSKEGLRMSSVKVICHHGIKGQKWGVKNGPPYPLATGDHSASEKKFIVKKKSSKSSSESSKSKKSSQNIDKKRKVAK